MSVVRLETQEKSLRSGFRSPRQSTLPPNSRLSTLEVVCREEEGLWLSVTVWAKVEGWSVVVGYQELRWWSWVSLAKRQVLMLEWLTDNSEMTRLLLKPIQLAEGQATPKTQLSMVLLEYWAMISSSSPMRMRTSSFHPNLVS